MFRGPINSIQHIVYRIDKITKFYILLTVQHLDVMLVNNQLDALFFKCIYSYFYTSTCLEQQVLIIRRFSLYQYTIWYNIL